MLNKGLFFLTVILCLVSTGIQAQGVDSTEIKNVKGS